jgi:hypothetical protein
MTFSGSCFIECKGQVMATRIDISGASLTIRTDQPPLFWTSPSNIGEFDIVIAYCQVTRKGTEMLSSLTGPFLHIRNLTLPDSVSDSSTLCLQTENFEQCIRHYIQEIRSIVVMGPGKGIYSARLSVDGICYQATFPDGRSSFALDSNSSFVDVVSFILCPSATPFPTKSGSDMFKKSSGMSFTNIAHSGWLNGSMLFTSIEPPTGPQDAYHSQSEELSVVWVSLAAILGALAIVVALILILVFHRRTASPRECEETETDAEAPADTTSAVNEMQTFFSAENALSHDRCISVPKAPNNDNADESILPVVLQ